MAQNYKFELDKQLARKQVKPQDMLDNYEYDESMAFQNQRTQAFPVNQNGTFVRDQEYDNMIQKFIARDISIDSNYKKEMFDEDAFKRRNLRSKIVIYLSNVCRKSLPIIISIKTETILD